MLLAMTIIGITAIKISSVDLLIASNFQQQLSVYQAAETKIQSDVNFYHLYNWMMDDKQPPASIKDRMISNAEVADLKRDYPCKGRSNLANSLGPDSPTCKLFLFAIDAKIKGTGVKENHYKGAGKQFPNQSNGSYY